MGTKYNHLTLNERIELYRLHADGIGIRQRHGWGVRPALYHARWHAIRRRPKHGRGDTILPAHIVLLNAGGDGMVGINWHANLRCEMRSGAGCDVGS